MFARENELLFQTVSSGKGMSQQNVQSGHLGVRKGLRALRTVI